MNKKLVLSSTILYVFLLSFVVGCSSYEVVDPDTINEDLLYGSWEMTDTYSAQDDDGTMFLNIRWLGQNYLDFYEDGTGIIIAEPWETAEPDPDTTWIMDPPDIELPFWPFDTLKIEFNWTTNGDSIALVHEYGVMAGDFSVTYDEYIINYRNYDFSDEGVLVPGTIRFTEIWGKLR